MSTEDNINETETPSQPEVAAEAPSSTAGASEKAANVVANLMQLKESNPKVFFGGIGGIALLLLVIMFSGGSDKKLPTHQLKPISIGQSYVLKSPNTYDSNATIRLVSVPGSMAAYDDTEENDRDGGCKHMPQNTPVKLIQSQVDGTDKNVVWVEIEVTAAGECQGRKAWTSAINLQ